ncbi:hypothetical protein [Moraxella pluranimalium]|uniref:hypothetical protein n=1 Tax=Moraxella pluranimalium TaxID=470453 RepID=UPI00117D8573|nr:hypothetical protein [Moraxella pluranimalium]
MKRLAAPRLVLSFIITSLKSKAYRLDEYLFASLTDQNQPLSKGGNAYYNSVYHILQVLACAKPKPALHSQVLYHDRIGLIDWIVFLGYFQNPVETPTPSILTQSLILAKLGGKTNHLKSLILAKSGGRHRM